ncbi:MAG: hypothetical protein K2V38_27695 [Gemmataceae bacterium]|nr:hypothetical protein [Gemmataceae bacterium]
MTGEGTVFVVSRLNWRPSGGSWWLAPGTARLASFPTRDEAEVDRARREANARRRVNPFECGKAFAELTAMPEDIFLDWVTDTGLSPPEPQDGKPRDWAAWWDATKPDMSPERHAKLWEALTGLHFFRVDERPDVPVGYAVLSLCWQYNDQWSYLASEGGTVQEVYRTRAGALEAARKVRSGGEGESVNWHPAGADLFDPEVYWEIATAGGPQFDIVEIELEGVQ